MAGFCTNPLTAKLLEVLQFVDNYLNFIFREHNYNEMNFAIAIPELCISSALCTDIDATHRESRDAVIRSSMRQI